MNSPESNRPGPDDDLTGVVGDLSALGLSKVIAAGLGLVNVLLISSIFSAEEYGRYVLFQLVLGTFLTLGIYWSGLAVVRFGREELEETGALRAAFWARLVFAGAILVAGIALALPLRERILDYMGLPAHVFGVLLVAAVIHTLFDHLNKTLQASRRIKWHAMAMLLQVILMTAGLLAIRSGIWDRDIARVVSLYFWSSAAALAFAVLGIAPRTVLPGKMSSEMLGRIVRFSFPQLLGFAGVHIVNWIDVAMIRGFLGTSEVGVYQFGYRFFTGVMNVSMIVATVLTPLMVSLRTKKRTGMIAKYAADAVPLFVLLFAMVLLAGAAPLRWVIETAASSDYALAPSIALMLFSAALFRFTSIAIVPVLNSHDRIGIIQVANLTVAGANVVLDIVLIPTVGVLGAAMATVVSYLAGATILVLYMRKLAPVNESSLLRILAIAVPGFFLAALAPTALASAGLSVAFLALLLLYARITSLVRPTVIELIEMVDLPEGARKSARRVLGILGGIGAER